MIVLDQEMTSNWTIGRSQVWITKAIHYQVRNTPILLSTDTSNNQQFLPLQQREGNIKPSLETNAKIRARSIEWKVVL
jgi:hypothetical protein